MKVKNESEVAQLFPNLRDPMDCSLPGPSVDGSFQARVLIWFSIPPLVNHILSELSTVTSLSWMALHGMAHSFIELDKAVVHVISLISFL